VPPMARRTRTRLLVIGAMPADEALDTGGLAANGLSVTPAETLEALRALGETDFPLALVVAEESAEGLRAIRALRRRHAGTAIVAALAGLDERTVGEAINAGADLCLALPLGCAKAVAQALTLALSARQAAASVTELSGQLGSVREQLTAVGMLDAASGAYNDKFLAARLTEEIARSKRYSRALSILLVDIDQYRAFTEENGERLGDFLVRQVVALLRWGLRPSDCICRAAVDQFVVILPETPLSGAIAAAEKVRRCVEEADFMRKAGATLVAVTTSIGCAEYSTEVETGDDLIRLAEAALYEAKVRGKNTVRW